MLADTPKAPLAEMPSVPLYALGDTEVCAAAIEPIVLAVRAKHPGVKRAVHERLSPPRRALFAFWVAYGHARDEGWSRLLLEVPYLTEFPGFFGDLRDSFAYFGCGEMAGLAEKAGAIFGQQAGEQPESASATRRALDARYGELAPGCLRAVARRIREQPHHYFRDPITESPPRP